MKIYDQAVALMGMNNDIWRRHANPWSVWTRIPIIFVLVPVAYAWGIFGWYIIIPLIICVLWIYINPRIFSPVEKIESWASKGVYGEKIFIERKKNNASIRDSHIYIANILTLGALFFAIVLIIGILTLNIWMTVLGTCMTWTLKMWFVDRMTFIYEEHKDIISLTQSQSSHLKL